MKLSDLEKTVLEVFEEGEVLTLKMVSRKIGEPYGPSKQRVWRALQLLMARDLVKKVDRGLYRLSNKG